MSDIQTLAHGHYAYLAGAEAVNREILAGFEQFKDDPKITKSHFFEGRYENIYIKEDRIAALQQMISRAIDCVGQILELDPAKLQCGFWFNSMQPGDITLPHRHDDDDELMSAVYYVTSPENSGNLVLGQGNSEEIVVPEAGKFVFFRPDLMHRVSRNQSDQHRLSIGMNFGLKQAFKSE